MNKQTFVKSKIQPIKYPQTNKQTKSFVTLLVVLKG